MRHVELGCGRNKPLGAYGIDISPDSDADLVADLSNGIPLPDHQASLVTSHHFMEHMASWPALLWDTWRVLEPGGTVSFCVPYAQAQSAADPSHPGLVTEYWLRNCWEVHAYFEDIVFSFKYDERLLEVAQRAVPGASIGDLKALFWNVCTTMTFTATARHEKLSREDAEDAKTAYLEGR